MFKVLKTIIVVLCFWVAPVCAGQASSIVALFDQETSARIEMLLQSRDAESVPLVGVSRLFTHEDIFKLYQQRGFLPIWIDGWQLRPAAQTLLDNLRSAGEHGLCGNDYLLIELEGLVRIQMDFARHNLPLAADNRAVLDLFLSQAFLTFATHMVEGQVDPALAHVDWRARRRKADLIKLLEYAIENRRMSQVLENLIPPHEEYRQLVSALRTTSGSPPQADGQRFHQVRQSGQMIATKESPC